MGVSLPPSLYPRRPYRRSRSFGSLPVWLRLTLGLLLGLLILLAGGSAWLFFSLPRGEEGASRSQLFADRLFQLTVPPSVFFRGRDRVNLLLIGSDVNRDRRGQPTDTLARTDTILVASIDRWLGQVFLLSIPRDTLVEIPGHGFQKINAAHALGGPLLLIEVLDRNLGIRVHHYVRTRFEGFIELVDLLGGVMVDVEKEMHYDDNWGQLHIHLQPGLQLLDGDKAHQYVRFRHDREGDFGRVRRQQQVLKAIGKKALSAEMLPRLPGVLRTMQRYVDTDLTTRELVSLAAYSRSLNPELFETATLPVVDGEGTTLVVAQDAPELLERMLGNTFSLYAWENRPHRQVASRRPGRTAHHEAELDVHPLTDWEVASPSRDEDNLDEALAGMTPLQEPAPLGDLPDPRLPHLGPLASSQAPPSSGGSTPTSLPPPPPSSAESQGSGPTEPLPARPGPPGAQEPEKGEGKVSVNPPGGGQQPPA